MPVFLPANRETSAQVEDRIERALERVERASTRLDARHRALREAATATLRDLDRLISDANADG